MSLLKKLKNNYYLLVYDLKKIINYDKIVMYYSHQKLSYEPRF